MTDAKGFQEEPQPWTRAESEVAKPVPEHDTDDHVQNRDGGCKCSVEIPQAVVSRAMGDEDWNDRRHDEDRNERQNPDERHSIAQVRAYAPRFAGQMITQTL